MTEAEIMKCAAILTAGLLAAEHSYLHSAEDAIDQMEEIAEEIRKRQEQKQRSQKEWL